MWSLNRIYNENLVALETVNGIYVVGGDQVVTKG